MKGLEVGITELERRPKTTGYTYASLSYMLDDIETEWGGTTWGYTLIHNADKLDKVASIIHDYLMGKILMMLFLGSGVISTFFSLSFLELMR